MRSLKLDLMTFDVGVPCESPAAFARLMSERVLQGWDEDADVVVFPEFAWMGLERFVEGPDKLQQVADLFWGSLWPDLLARLTRPDRAAVLGTVPFRESCGAIRNRAPILHGGLPGHQDKIHLTPWEGAFTGGGPVRIWNFRGIRIAVVICMDVEIPEISAALRGRAVDLLLVPSATESLLGVERVGRCAEARSVELCCHVGLCHLVGRMNSEWVDENIGKLAVYSPSQSPFAKHPRRIESEVHESGFHRLSTVLDIDALRGFRGNPGETDPSKAKPAHIAVVEPEHPFC